MKKHIPESMQKQIAKLKAQGCSTREVAQAVGVSQRTVLSWFQRIDDVYEIQEHIYDPAIPIMPGTAEYKAWFDAMNPITNRSKHA